MKYDQFQTAFVSLLAGAVLAYIGKAAIDRRRRGDCVRLIPDSAGFCRDERGRVWAPVPGTGQ